MTESIEVKVFKADGTLHRRCRALVEHASELGWVVATASRLPKPGFFGCGPEDGLRRLAYFPDVG